MYGENEVRGQLDGLSERLGHLTYWGDYGGDIVARYHYTMLLENYPDVVRRSPEMWGQQLAIDPQVDYSHDNMREVIRFIAAFDPNSREYIDYPIYDLGFSEFEWEQVQREMTEGWWAEYSQKELADEFSEWTGNTMVPDFNTPEWATLVYDFLQDSDEYPYFETADSIVVPGWDAHNVAMWLLERYADEITNAGNPAPLI